jgi:23S rRNA pseudouridine2605 synthase
LAERLQKYLASCGVASRRKSEDLVREGRVRVNGKTVNEMGVVIEPGVDEVTLDGVSIRPALAGNVYYMLHKPRGYLVSASDPFGRRTIYELLQHLQQRVFPVGRLDLDSEGLLLLTNDGDLSHRMMHPRYGIEKEYEVWVSGEPGDEQVALLETGVQIEGRITSPARLYRAGVKDGICQMRIIISEGRKRQVRQMFAAVGHPVIRLRRIREGSLRLGSLPLGKVRPLTEDEISAVRSEVGL